MDTTDKNDNNKTETFPRL